MIAKKTNLSAHDAASIPRGDNYSVGIAVAEWNPTITNALLEAAVSTLEINGVKKENIRIDYVPGTFELSFAAKLMLNDDSLDAIIVLGCVIQGETRHFDFICQGISQGITDLNIEGKKPVIFGVLTTGTMQQALDRAGGKHGNKGDEAAVTALKMIKFNKSILRY